MGSFEFDLNVPGYRVTVTVGETFGLRAEPGPSRHGGVSQNVTAGRDVMVSGGDMTIGPGVRQQVTTSGRGGALTLTVPPGTTIRVHAGTDVEPDASARRGRINIQYV
jgi:hypothetical protein